MSSEGFDETNTHRRPSKVASHEPILTIPLCYTSLQGRSYATPMHNAICSINVPTLFTGAFPSEFHCYQLHPSAPLLFGQALHLHAVRRRALYLTFYDLLAMPF